MRILFVSVLLATLTLQGAAQSNVIFSVPNGYQFDIRLGSYTPNRTEPWQVRFDQVLPGKYKLTLWISNNSGYNKTVSYTMEMVSGWEAVYFITPLQETINYNLAYYLPLSRIIPETPDPGNAASGNGRLKQFLGKPVIGAELLEELYKIAGERRNDYLLLDYFKSVMPEQYFYTEDILYLQQLFRNDFLRLDFLKLAFHQCVDQANVFRMEKAFRNKFLFQDFMEYAKQHKRQ